MVSFQTNISAVARPKWRLPDRAAQPGPRAVVESFQAAARDPLAGPRELTGLGVDLHVPPSELVVGNRQRRRSG